MQEVQFVAFRRAGAMGAGDVFQSPAMRMNRNALRELPG